MFVKIILFCCLHQLAQAIPAPGHGALAGYCDTSDHCASDECCVSFNQPRGKRTVLTSLSPDLMSLVHGSCQKRGTEGSRCIVNGGLTTGTSGLFYDCPCMSAFGCEGTGQMIIPKGEGGLCRSNMTVKVSSIGRQCHSGADCADTECCLSDIQPIGKRTNIIMSKQAGGHCHAMGTSGSSCLVKLGSGKPDHMVYSCPCFGSLTCHGSGFFEVPLGERGTCQALKG